MKKGFKNNKGVTMITLIVTIIIIIIFSTISIRGVFGEHGMLKRAQTERAETDEIINSEKTETQGLVNQHDEMTAEKEKREKVVDALKSTSSLQEVEYTPATVSTNYVVPDKYSGINTGATDLTIGQSFTQEDLIGTSSERIKWYVFGINDNGVNLVSEPTKTGVEFRGPSGYDNCLYYLNEMSTSFFVNDDIGVTSDKVHALRLSDIKTSAEQINKSDNNWNWDTNFVENATAGDFNYGETANYGDEKAYYPKLYTPDESSNVVTNNQVFDENIPGALITNDTGTLANSLTVTATFFNYKDLRDSQMTNLGTFGQSAIANEIFNSAKGNYWLASRCINPHTEHTNFNLRNVESGVLYSRGIYGSQNTQYTPGAYKFRIVVSVPWSEVNVSDEGIVTLM